LHIYFVPQEDTNKAKRDMGSPAAGQKLRVLVAEDEHLAALVVEDALVDQGHEVVLARDGQEALDIEGLAFDVLVTDLAMPRVTGWELIPLLRARRAACRWWS